MAKKDNKVTKKTKDEPKATATATQAEPQENLQAGQKSGMLPITINAQYVRDLSIENPNAPMSLAKGKGSPAVNMHVDVGARKLEGEQFKDETYEVALNIRAEAKQGEETSFIVELSYGGVFSLGGLQKEHRNPVLLIEGPRMLFPFARAIIAEATRDAGFPPLMVNPIDFAELYRKQLTALREKLAAEANDKDGDKKGGKKEKAAAS